MGPKVVTLHPQTEHISDRAPTIAEMREIAADSKRVIWLCTPRRKAAKRGITMKHIETCIQKGTFVEGPFKNERQDWQATVQRHAAGEEMKVVVIFKDGTLLVRSNH